MIRRLALLVLALSLVPLPFAPMLRAQQPVASSFVNLLNAAPATATVSSPTPVRIPNFGTAGGVQITFAGITGSPSGCRLQFFGVDSLGNQTSTYLALLYPLTVANGTTDQTLSSTSAPPAEQFVATFSCSSTYPTAGTISVDYAPSMPVSLVGTASVNIANSPAVRIGSSVDSTLNGTITAQDTLSSTTTVANAQVFVTGSATGTSYVAYLGNVNSFDTLNVLVTGTWTGTLQVEGGADVVDDAWIPLAVYQYGTNYATTSFTQNFAGQANITNFQDVRVRATPATSWTGTANVALSLSVNPLVHVNVLPTKIQDGVAQSTLATVKAPSTAAVGGDTALVVAISPNNTVPVSGSVTANQGTRTDTAPASQNITAQDTASTTIGVANGASFITGSPTANSAASFALASGFQSVTFQVAGTWTGTVAVEASMDGGTTWISAGVHEQGTTYVIASFTSNFVGEHNSEGYTNVRVRATASWTGTATVKVVQTINNRLSYIANPLNLRDGTTQSIVNTIKAASTQSVAGDTSLVMQLNPNQPNLTTPLNFQAADGQLATLGSKADAKNTATDTTAITVMQVLKEISALEQAPATRAVTNAGTFEVQPDGTTATTTNAASRCTLVSAASTNATNCKGSSGNVYGFRFVNTTATLYYLRMYNTSSSPTCSSATGFIESIPIPASATGAGIVAIEPMGEGYSTGISFCFTGGSSSTDNSNAATGVFGSILYK